MLLRNKLGCVKVIGILRPLSSLILWIWFWKQILNTKFLPVFIASLQGRKVFFLVNHRYLITVIHDCSNQWVGFGLLCRKVQKMDCVSFFYWLSVWQLILTQMLTDLLCREGQLWGLANSHECWVDPVVMFMWNVECGEFSWKSFKMEKKKWYRRWKG